jgi:hypothetical protein
MAKVEGRPEATHSTFRVVITPAPSTGAIHEIIFDDVAE